MERNTKGQFTSGIPAHNRHAVGTIRIRTRRKRGGEQRQYIKIAEPNKWILYCHYIWEQARGPIPRGMGIHHIDRNKLNDSIDNLELVSKSEHLAIHRPDFQDKSIVALVNARRTKRWSTKSKTKLTGRPPVNDPAVVGKAAAAYLRGEGTYTEIAKRFDISANALSKRVRAQRT